MPTLDALAEALAAYVWDECERLVYVQAPGESRLSARGRAAYLDGAEAVERVARNAADYRLARWTPEYIADMQRLGSVGGSISRRPPTKATPANLARLATLPPGLTVSEQADALDLSPATIKRLRAMRERPETP